MISDRELDVQLAAAAVVRDEDLPALPETFLALLMFEGRVDSPTRPEDFFALVMSEDQVDRSAESPEQEPASVIAARQLVDDARDARTATWPRHRPSRRLALRCGAAVVAIAAGWTTAVVVTPFDASRTPPSSSATLSGQLGANEIRLVAVEQATFPVSLDPAPVDLTPSFNRWGGDASSDGQPLVLTADYRSPDGDGFTMWIYPKDPRRAADLDDDYTRPQDEPDSYDIETSGTVSVDGTDAEYAQGAYPVPDSGSRTFADPLWERADGQWVHILGNDTYGRTTALVAVAQSLVDRPQPIGLQFGLAPAGWSLSGYEQSGSIDVTNDADPGQRLHLSLIGRQGGVTVDTAYEGLPFAGPPERVTINGQPGLLAFVDDGVEYPNYWILAGQFSDTTLPIFLLLAPEQLTREQVLEIASQITYNP